MPVISFVKTDIEQKNILSTIRRAMELANWQDYIKKGKILIKINAVSAFSIPGANTSPLVLGGVLHIIREVYPDSELMIVDTDTAARSQLDKVWQLWGYDNIAREYNADIVNLTNEKWIEVPVEGHFLKKLFVPELLLGSDSLISIPVLKTHTWSKLTCALKNQYGFTPKDRHLFHTHLDQVIADINSVCSPDFIVVDGTVCLEAGGPVLGKPKLCNMIMASHDPVAIDTIACKYTGMEPKDIGYIKLSEELGIGSSRDIEIVGDSFESDYFIPAVQNLNSIWHKRLRMSPFGDFLFKSFIFKLMCLTSTAYQIYWFYKNKKKLFSKLYFPKNYCESIQWGKDIYISS